MKLSIFESRFLSTIPYVRFNIFKEMKNVFHDDKKPKMTKSKTWKSEEVIA